MKNAVTGLLAGFLCMAASGARVQAQSLIVNGSVASTGLKTINGKVYVPLADVAKSFNQVIVKRPGGYELTDAGGGNEVGDAHQGKIGDVIFTGQFRFTVTGIQKVDSYTTHDYTTMTVTPNAGNSLFVVSCRIKNGTPKKQELVFATGGAFDNQDTALTDDNAHSYAPYVFEGGEFGGYDVHVDETAPVGSYILPGAAVDFAIVFDAPSDTNPTGLVFSILKYGDRLEATKNAVDVRVKLAP